MSRHRVHYTPAGDPHTACGLPALRLNRPRGISDPAATTCRTCKRTDVYRDNLAARAARAAGRYRGAR